jgi:hypothetical protein
MRHLGSRHSETIVHCHLSVPVLEKGEEEKDHIFKHLQEGGGVCPWEEGDRSANPWDGQDENLGFTRSLSISIQFRKRSRAR